VSRLPSIHKNKHFCTTMKLFLALAGLTSAAAFTTAPRINQAVLTMSRPITALNVAA
jgi:hypothetical protein